MRKSEKCEIKLCNQTKLLLASFTCGVLQLLTGKVNKIVKWLYYDNKEQALQLFLDLYF